jgi:hypothetical protein
MKFAVEKLPAAAAEIEALEQSQKELKYKAGAIIVIGVVFVKKAQKTPKEKIKLAVKRLKEV